MDSFEIICCKELDEIQNSRGNFRFLEDLSEVNFIFGKNNSRKSRLIRELLRQGQFLVSEKGMINSFFEIKSILKDIIETANSLVSKGTMPSTVIWNLSRMFHSRDIETKSLIRELNTSSPIAPNYHQMNPVVLLDEVESIWTRLIDYKLEKKQLQDLISPIQNAFIHHLECYKFINTPSQKSHLNHSLHFKNIDNQLEDVIDCINRIKLCHFSNVTPVKHYIPALRNAADIFSLNSNDSMLKTEVAKAGNPYMFKDFLSKKYELNEHDNLTIFDGTDYYHKILRLRNSEKSKREQIDKFEEFLASTFFDGKAVEIVSDYEDKSIRLKLPNQADRFLHDIGDGLQNLIILMYPIFTAPKGTWIFIDEPENNMHPGLQSIFIQALLKNKSIIEKELKIFITTHSNHILDVGVDSNKVSYFSIKNKGKTSEIRNLISPDNNVLSDLGVYNSSVLLSNCSVWVEGISDRRILQGFLKLYCDNMGVNLLEGYHFSFFEYAGNNLIHYDFSSDDELTEIKALLLSNKIFLLADVDEKKAVKHKKYKTFSNGEDFIYQTTIGKEIENIIPPKLIFMFLQSIKTKPSFLQTDFVYNDYKNIGLGAYLDGKKFKVKKFQSSDSRTGTLSSHYKNKLSHFIFETCMNADNVTWGDIQVSKAAKEIIPKLYDFIVKSNESHKL
jgi:hypothetical protein